MYLAMVLSLLAFHYEDIPHILDHLPNQCSRSKKSKRETSVKQWLSPSMASRR